MIKTTKYSTPYGSAHFCNNAIHNSIALSGGFDSAVALYYLAKTLSENNINATIYPFTVQRGNPTPERKLNRVSIVPYVRRIIKYTRNVFPNITIKNPLVEMANYHWVAYNVNGANIGSYTTAQQTLTNFIEWRHRTRIAQPHYTRKQNQLIVYNGVTRNPPKGCIEDSEEEHRDHLHPEPLKKNSATVHNHEVLTFGKLDYDYHSLQVWRNSDKRIVFWLAKEAGILDDMLHLTRSCEGGPDETHDFTKVCGECWWCLERDWAHENYMNLDIKHEE